MMGDYFYTLRDDAPAWADEMWPGEDGELMSPDDIPTQDEGHTWEHYNAHMGGTPIRRCTRCGTRETYWDDDMYGPDFCIRDLRPYCDCWEIVATVDHGLRTADETMAYECAIFAHIIMSPIIYAWAKSAGYMLHAPTWSYGLAVDAWAAACEEIAPYDGGWCEPTDDDPDAMRATWLHGSMVCYRSYDDCPDVMVETPDDAGMTWFAVRVSDGAR